MISSMCNIVDTPFSPLKYAAEGSRNVMVLLDLVCCTVDQVPAVLPEMAVAKWLGGPWGAVGLFPGG